MFEWIHDIIEWIQELFYPIRYSSGQRDHLGNIELIEYNEEFYHKYLNFLIPGIGLEDIHLFIVNNSEKLTILNIKKSHGEILKVLDELKISHASMGCTRQIYLEKNMEDLIKIISKLYNPNITMFLSLCQISKKFY